MKSLDKVWYSAKELEKWELPGLPKQATNITRKALRENWSKREMVGIKGGGNEYHITSLPKEAQRVLGFKDYMNSLRELVNPNVSDEAENVASLLANHLIDLGISMINRYFSINVSAGFGSFNDGVTEPDGQEPYSDSLLASLGVNADKCAVFKAKGDSMLPTIESGDQLLVDLTKNTIKGDNIYLVQNGESVWVKRVRVEWEGVKLISDNKEEYAPIVMSRDEAENLQIIGQVVHIGHSLI